MEGYQNEVKPYQDKEWHEEALKLRGLGLSSRKIGKALGLGKSTINYYFEKYDNWSKVKESTKDNFNGMKVLFWDLETSLMEGYFFKIWKENIQPHRIKKHSHLLSASWAFNNDKPEGVRLTPEQVKTGDDLEVVIALIEAINKADLIVSFNGKKFDCKVLNTRALYWGLPPVKNVKHLDLFEQAKRNFRFPSNSMQSISIYLGEEGKIQTGSTRLWERCANYDDYIECDKALKEMLTYNLQDINATRDLYYKFLGWSKNTPNIGTIANDINDTSSLRCVHCGSEDLTKMDSKGYTSMSSFDLYRCGNNTCRGISRINATGKVMVNAL